MNEEVEQVEQQEQTSKKKRAKLVPVRLVETSGMSALVEWNDGSWKRVYIPIEEFDREKSKVDDSVLKAGIPYGVDWSEAEILPFTADDLCQELYKNGIWMLDDLSKNIRIVQVILLRLTNATRALIEVAQEQKE